MGFVPRGKSGKSTSGKSVGLGGDDIDSASTSIVSSPPDDVGPEIESEPMPAEEVEESSKKKRVSSRKRVSSKRRDSGKRSSSKRQSVRKPAPRGAILALHVHGSVFFSVIILLMGINLLSILLTRNKFPWSLYIWTIWGSVVLMHFALTWSIFKALKIDTSELDAMVRFCIKTMEWAIESFGDIFTKGFNPFPANSRLARLYDYLMLGVEPDELY